jgi:stage III sporulation protein AE
LPMLLAAGVLTIVDGLSDKLKVGRTVKLLHKSVKWLLGLLTTVYIAVTVVGGMTAGAADGISVRTAKYAIDRLVPAAGGMVTGAADAVLGSSALLKNSAGTVAIILAAAVIAKPMLTVAGGMFALRITSAICEPFSDERIPKMLDGIAETVSYLFAAVAAVTGMFVISLVVMLLTGNALAV